MEKIIVINGSPRAIKSNSKKYAEVFMSKIKIPSEYINISKNNHNDIITKMRDVDQVVIVFPLYVDSIPSTLLNFFKSLEDVVLDHKPVISIIINCGFIEHLQNNVAIEMVKLFCKRNGYRFGSILSIGSGEAIMTTPFRVLVYYKIGLFCKTIVSKRYKKLVVTMPMPKILYIKASTGYWLRYGAKYGITKEDMEIMTVE